MKRSCKKSVPPILALAALGFVLSGRAAGDSLNIRLAGEWPFSGLTSVIGVASRNLAFVGSGGGVYVLDISNPDTPQVLSMKIQTLGTANDLFYESSTQRLYVAGQQSGLSIWDVSTATNPQRLGVCRTPSQAYRVVVSGGYAYVADRDSGLRIINVSTPTNPYQAGRYVTPGDVQAIAVSGSYAYVGDGNYLRVINVSNPANPYQTGACDSLITLGIAQADSFVYVVNGYSGLIVVNVADSTHPYRMGQCPPQSYAVDIALRGHYAYVADDMFGYLVIDVSDPWNPRDTSGYGGGGKWWVTVSDTLAFFIGDHVDINNVVHPIYPHEVGGFSPPTLRGSCAVCGQYAYAGSSQGLLVFDISDPQNLHEIGLCSFGSLGSDVVIQGQYAYVCNQMPDGLFVINVSDASNPLEVGSCNVGDVPMRIAVSGTFACMAGQNSVPIVNIANPDSPFVVGCYQNSAQGVAALDTLVFLARGWSGLQIIGISDPAHPTELGNCPVRHSAWDVAVCGTHAYVADADSGLMVVDVSDPRNPFEVARFRTPGWAAWVAASAPYVYVADFDSRLQILDVSDPTNPVLVGFYDGAGVEQNIVPVGRYIYVAGSGLHIYENLAYGVEEPRAGPVVVGSVRLLENPVRDREIALEIYNVKHGTAAFRLYNVAGEQVKQYRLTGLGSGTNVVRLPVDGLAAGLYILRTNEPQSCCGIKVVVGK
jgi:hypothetical protein